MTLVVGNKSDTARRENLLMAECWLSVEEISVHLGVSSDSVYKWILAGRCPARSSASLEIPRL